jgi:ATP-dependent Clp protease ATP-binding subunit ClpA
MKWIKEIARYSKVKNTFVLYGNIYDIYGYESEGRVLPLGMDKFLSRYLREKEGYKKIVKFDPLFGFEGIDFDYKKQDIILENAYNTIKELFKEEGVCIVLNFASRLQDIANNDFITFLYKLFRDSMNATPKMVNNEPKYNLLIFLIEKENDLPSWFYMNNLSLRTIAVAKPNDIQREHIASHILNTFFNDYKELDKQKQKEILDFFVSQTSGMYAKEIISIATLGLRENLKSTQISEAIRRYKIGILENPWANINKGKIKKADDIIKKRVIGQDEAVKKAVKIIKRAFYNLSGAQFSRYSNKPKGVLFLAGATGVGKTELAKSITELIFGSESNYIRFDMSEFSKEHSDQRLIGAPPGYVGYDVGGELVNKVKENPFSVILFDEIEKAHPKILDIFLQILDDGRLTSGSGETIYFSESIIIFTSNLGIYKEENGKRILNVSIEDDYENIKNKIYNEIENFFTIKINRPEILNRIGKNIVVFDFIRKENAYKIFEKMLNNVLYKLEDEHKIELIIEDNVKDVLKEESVKDLTMGGRGIGNQLEDIFINPLAELLFDLDIKEKDKVIINEIIKDGTNWKLSGYKLV